MGKHETSMPDFFIRGHEIQWQNKGEWTRGVSNSVAKELILMHCSHRNIGLLFGVRPQHQAQYCQLLLTAWGPQEFGQDSFLALLGDAGDWVNNLLPARWGQTAARLPPPIKCPLACKKIYSSSHITWTKRRKLNSHGCPTISSLALKYYGTTKRQCTTLILPLSIF